MIKTFPILSEQDIDYLQKNHEIFKFNTACHLFYEFQIPNISVVILKGETLLLKKKKVFFTLGPHNLIGLEQLILNSPSEMACKVMANSELIVLNKSEILNAMKTKASRLYSIIKENQCAYLL